MLVTPTLWVNMQDGPASVEEKLVRSNIKYTLSLWFHNPASSIQSKTPLKNKMGRDLQDGGRVRRGDHLPPHKYLRNTSTCGATPTEHLLNAGRRHQTPQKPCGWQGLVALASVRPVPLRWESRVQDIGPAETSWPHVISNGESSYRDFHLNAKAQEGIVWLCLLLLGLLFSIMARMCPS